MKKRKTILSLFLILIGSVVFAATYDGNIYVKQSDYTAYSIYFLDNSTPAVNHDLKTSNDVDPFEIKENFTDSQYPGDIWVRFNFKASPKKNIYVLYNGTTIYAVEGVFALAAAGGTPAKHFISAPTFYQAATPLAPGSVGLVLEGLKYPGLNGIVSSSIGVLDSNYQSTGEKYELFNVTGGLDGQNDGVLGDSVAGPGNGTLSNHEILDSGGELYRVKAAYVNWFTDNDEKWGESVNRLVPDIEEGEPVSHSLLLTFVRDPIAPNVGINSFSMPVTPVNPEADPDDMYWYATYVDDLPLYDGAEIRTAYDLVKAINQAADQDVVSTFGEWNEAGMSENGVLLKENNPDALDTQEELEAIKLKPGEGYQLYYIGENPTSIKIKN